jgi:hypothetical protein
MTGNPRSGLSATFLDASAVMRKRTVSQTANTRSTSNLQVMGPDAVFHYPPSVTEPGAEVSLTGRTYFVTVNQSFTNLWPS